MGVQGLWELLSPVGRRVSVETLAGKKLAIDASIWIVQFMKAMRDEKGEMVRNAHLIGFFRRICKLMFLRAKPVFVFDGGTPALKRRTVIARRRQRENAQAKVRKTAEKLLLNHLKATRLKELAVDLESQRKMNDAKGKKVINEETESARNSVEETKNVPASFNQEELDALLAASLAAEEDQNFAGNASTSGAGITIDEDEDDEDEEMILPVMSGEVDPAVLASLPPSMQLDLLVQMRERLMAENRQKYQKVKKAPAKFSELQIQSYLKTVAFRREINQVQKIAAGKDMGGVQTSRIASEANREFIFSSSFSGDKEALASAGVEGHSKNSPYKKPSEISSAFLDCISSTSKSNAETGPVADNPNRVPDEEIETFQDDRRRFRVSRVSDMGIRMTRDLQRNLDMIKEIEQDRRRKDEVANRATNLQENVQLEATSSQAADGSVHSVEPKDPSDEFKSGDTNFMEISFEDDGGEKCLDDDDIFARLVAGEEKMISSFNSGSSKKHSSSSDLDRNWEGLIDERVRSHPDTEKGSLPSNAKDGDDESEVEWEDDDSFDLKCASQSPNEISKVASKGVLEEEADFQEALRRSLKDLSGDESSEVPLEDKTLEEDMEMGHETAGAGSLHQENENGELLENVIEMDEFSEEVLTEVGRIEAEALAKKKNSDDPVVKLPTYMAVSHDITSELEKSIKKSPTSDAEPLIEDKSEIENLLGIRLEESRSPVEETGIPLIAEQRADTIQTSSIAVQPNLSEAAAYDNSSETTKEREVYVKESTANHYDFSEKTDFGTTSAQRRDEPEEFAFQDELTNPIQFTKADLEEEIQSLSQECMELGDQQRKLNRNMESVSSEMFAECQELLQMFGLPYIIAPMEAEAQCAYMELAGLVDGVVTDDSDAFLFGATSVYKNIFDDRKYVETYFMKDIENDLGLSRDKLIRMALLLGSDYTEGVSGIGIVNAIEVVNAFPEEDGFRKFREWIESPDPTILGKVGAQTGSSSRKKGSKVSDAITSSSNSNMNGVSASELAVGITTDDIDETKRLFMHKHRNVSKNWHIPSTFPNEVVISAYASPEVDKSTDPFSWGKPDHFVLRKLCWEKFGWNVQKADELLVPVLKEYNKRETQLRLEAFYTFNEKFAKIRSKRIQKAVRGIRGSTSSEMIDDDAQETSKSRKKRRVSPDECLHDVTKNNLSETNNTLTEDESNSAQRSSKKMSSKRKHREPVPSDENTKESEERSKGRKNIKRVSGSGRRGKGRGRRIKTPELDSSSSSDDVSNADCEKDIQAEKDETIPSVRKSTRARKAVKYTLDDLESGETSEEDQHEMNSDNPAPVEEQSSKDHGIVGNDAATLGEKIQKKILDPSLVECSNGHYLKMGGEFCMEESVSDFDTGNINPVPKDDLLFQEELPKEYLKDGGGFCLEEDGTDEDSIKRSLDDSLDRYVLDGEQKGDHSTPTSEVDFSVSAVSPRQGAKVDVSHMVPEKSLFAMPALKRKRR